MAKRMVITIGREFGSGGREIGKKLADLLGIAFYDKELLEIAAKESGISRDLFESNDEKPTGSLLYSMSVSPYPMGNFGTDHAPLTQKLFLAQFDAIRKLAAANDGVFVGRCADYALRDMPDCLNVFIHAPLQERISRIKLMYELSSGEAKDLIVKTDKKRAAYYNSYSDLRWGDMDTYHLTLDSNMIGMDNSALLIKNFLELRR